MSSLPSTAPTPSLDSRPTSQWHNPALSTKYERMTGGSTTLIAHSMLSILTSPFISASHPPNTLSYPQITPKSTILDLASGPGIITAAIKALHPDTKVHAADLSISMINQVESLAEKEGWKDVTTGIADFRNLKGEDANGVGKGAIPDAVFTHAFMNFGFIVPGDTDGGLKASKEMFRVLKQDGVAMISLWADRVFPTAFHNIAKTIRPHEPPGNEIALPPEYVLGSYLVKTLESSGFGNNVELRRVMTYSTTANMEEMVENMMPFAALYWKGYSEGELRRAKELMPTEIRSLRTFQELEGGDGKGVRFGMKAWIGVGQKCKDADAVGL